MKEKLEQIRKTALEQIRTYVEKFGSKPENALMLCDFDFGDSPIVKEDIYDGNLSETLDTIVLEDGNLQFHCGSAYTSTTYAEKDIDTDTLVGIVDWLDEHIDEEEWLAEQED